tara:strand:+ start:3163 stop:3588 length:426 start_codon:yes stop_codon:yes gene_type:complete
MAKWAQGKFNPKFPEKYVGGKTPTYRSSWEFAFMRFCDEHPSVQRWASEAIRIPYKNPFTGKMTIYVPDFFMEYIDKDGKSHVEVIEVKPANQTNLKEAKGSKQNQMHWILNQAKWEVARAWCKQQGIVFRVVNEGDIFHK